MTREQIYIIAMILAIIIIPFIIYMFPSTDCELTQEEYDKYVDCIQKAVSYPVADECRLKYIEEQCKQQQ